MKRYLILLTLLALSLHPVADARRGSFGSGMYGDGYGVKSYDAPRSYNRRSSSYGNNYGTMGGSFGSGMYGDGYGVRSYGARRRY